MNKNDLISKLYEEVEKYLQIRNTSIKQLVSDLYKIDGNNFMKDKRLLNIFSKHSEVEKLLEYFLKKEIKNVQQEKRVSQYTTKEVKTKTQSNNKHYYNENSYNESYYNERYDYDDRDLGIEDDINNYTPYNTNEENYDNGCVSYDEENSFYDD